MQMAGRNSPRVCFRRVVAEQLGSRPFVSRSSPVAPRRDLSINETRGMCYPRLMQESAIEILYLHDHPGRVFCRTCLARLAQAEQRSMVGRIAEIAGKTHVEGMGRCSECGEYSQVL